VSAAGLSRSADAHISEPDDSDDDTRDSRQKRVSFHVIYEHSYPKTCLAQVWRGAWELGFAAWPEIYCRALLRPSQPTVLPSLAHRQPLYFGSSEKAGMGCGYCKCSVFIPCGNLSMTLFKRKGTATLTSIPIGSNLFSTQHAAKKVVKSKPSNPEIAASDTPATPTPAATATTTPASFPHPPYTPFPSPSPYGYPPYTPYYGFPQPNFFSQPSFGQAGPSNWGQTAPEPQSSPPPAGSSLDDFCNNYNISFTACTKLEQLGFEIGDDLTSISQEQYESVGFKHLEWNRVLKAYRKFKRDQK